jgi:hypothetical protein
MAWDIKVAHVSQSKYYVAQDIAIFPAWGGVKGQVSGLEGDMGNWAIGQLWLPTNVRFLLTNTMNMDTRSDL